MLKLIYKSIHENVKKMKRKRYERFWLINIHPEFYDKCYNIW